jgi:hypothetical protein
MAYRLAINVTAVNGIPLAADLTAGTILIWRVRLIAGVEDVTLIVNSDVCSKANGQIFYDYNFSEADWQSGDAYRGEFSGQFVTILGVPYPLPPITVQGSIGNKLLIDTILARLASNVEQLNVAVSVSAISGSETDVLNLPVVADTCYTVQNLRLKCDDPGANTVTVRLYEKVDGSLTEVDSFAITGGGAGVGNWETFHSLMDMFGLPHLAGDNLQVTVRASGGAGYAVLGQYSYIKASPW